MLLSAVRNRAEQRVGTTLCGKWHLDAIVGAGGMATVYAATHRNRSRVAIKMLHPEYSIDDQIRSKFLREGYVANSIGHPGAVSIIDDDKTEDGAAFLVMELLSGETLGQRLKRYRRRFPRREALLIAGQLLEVLIAAHAKGVVHRDIKPDNLFITVGGQLKVLDFGIARLRAAAASGSTAIGMFFGTPGFAPPEQARGRSDEVDARSDLYAVGATLFARLAGRPVHQAETATERIALTISVPAPSIATVISDLPPAVAHVVDRALLYDKKERWPNAKAMLAAVRTAIQAVNDEVESEPPGTQDMPTPLLARLLDDCRTTVSLGNGPSSAIRAVGKKWRLKGSGILIAVGVAGAAAAVGHLLSGGARGGEPAMEVTSVAPAAPSNPLLAATAEPRAAESVSAAPAVGADLLPPANDEPIEAKPQARVSVGKGVPKERSPSGAIAVGSGEAVADGAAPPPVVAPEAESPPKAEPPVVAPSGLSATSGTEPSAPNLFSRRR